MEKTYQENRKKDNVVPFEIMLRKFNRQVQQNRLLSEVKRRRYVERKINRTEKRQIARHKSYVKKLKRGY